MIFGIGASFTRTSFGIQFPNGGKTFIHATLDPRDLNKDIRAEHALIGDAQLTLSQLDEAVRGAPRRQAARPARRASPRGSSVQRDEWLQQWMPKLTSTQAPLSPYRVIWDLLHTVDVANTVITHDAGSPRDQLSPFWKTTTPLSYIGWGKTTQLGYGLGLAMGAKLAHPDKLCINYLGRRGHRHDGHGLRDGRARAHPDPVHPAQQLLDGDRAAGDDGLDREVPLDRHLRQLRRLRQGPRRLRRARHRPGEIIPAIKRGIEQTKEGTPALLEFITQKETEISSWPAPNPGW